ncbi:MAG: DUF2752 domain-containing protein [Actinobacteria bacterium]|uniref:Unannotated protein n=1 Tax=freshwater metagenome TaxID=449393 RepID=A0A6J7SHP2_9ZZZZ|nr:DUF2752 domain-containing protein [Actinomycetota bacterium]
MDPDQLVAPSRVDERPLMRRLVAPVGVAALAVAGCTYLAFVNPNEPGHYPICPSRAIFGVDCPGCGGMRGMNCLLHGDIAGALNHNLLLVIVVPLALVFWGLWLIRAVRGRYPSVTMRQFQFRNRILITSLVLMLAFGVVRNFVPYLGSGV